MTELRRLLVATDGSEPAANAARFAGDLASRFDGSVVALSVVPKPSATAAVWLGAQVYMPSLAMETDRIIGAARMTAEEAALLAEKHGCPQTKTIVEVGDPAHTIVDMAGRYKAHAIVMGRRGTGNVSGLFMGSVSTRVSHLSETTVITVRAGDIVPGRILVAVDGSEHSMHAAQTACRLAEAYGAELEVLNVVAVSSLVPFGLTGEDAIGYDHLAGSLRDYGEQIVDEAARMAEDVGVAVGTAIAAGDPASRIIERAERIEADIVCIGRRGLGSVAGLLLGSVSHAVAHGCDRTIVAVT